MIAVSNFGTVYDAPWLEVCFHEAGHAVTAKHLGVSVTGLEANADGSGFTYFANDLLDPDHCTPHEVRTAQIVSAAGAVAETYAALAYAHQNDREAERWRTSLGCAADRADHDEARGLPGAISAETAYVEAQRILETRWGEVEELAFRLSENETLGRY